MKARTNAALAPLQKIDEVAAEQHAIERLAHSLDRGDRSPSDLLRELKWRQGDADRKLTAALRALTLALTRDPHSLPPEALAWISGHAPAPVFMLARTRAALRALVDGARPEETLFDAIGADVQEF